MSVDLIPLLVESESLDSEIRRLEGRLSRDAVNEALRDFAFEDSLKHQFLTPFRYSNASWSFDADYIRFQLLRHAWEKNETPEAPDGMLESAEALYQFLGAFFCCWTTSVPHNEYGFRSSTIINTPNARRLRFVFERIDFDLLRQPYEERCRFFLEGNLKGDPLGWITSFEKLSEYTSALKDLFLQAEQANKTLYIHVSY